MSRSSRDARDETRTAAAHPADDAPAIAFPPEQSVGYLMRETHRAFMRELQARIAPQGVTQGMWFFLRVLWEEDGLTQRELSQRVRMMEPTTVTALNNMEKRGLVLRVRNPDDRRKVNIFLTERGRRLRARLLPHAVATNQVALTGLGETEVEQLRAILRRMKRNLDAIGR
jgi:DNA-binding MarR family transcriptional regulator